MFVWGWVGSLCMHTCVRILTLYIASNLARFLSKIKNMVWIIYLEAYNNLILDFDTMWGSLVNYNAQNVKYFV